MVRNAVLALLAVVVGTALGAWVSTLRPPLTVRGVGTLAPITTPWAR